MLGIIICVSVSWLLLKLFKTDLSVLGFRPNKKRLKELSLGFGLSAVVAIAYFLYTVKVLNAEVKPNPEYDLFSFTEGSFWTLRSVFFEELVFRGALFFIAIKLIGLRKAVILSSVVFAVYHWFSYNILGEYTSMIYIFLITGIGGAMFAYAYALTGSLYLPIGLHFGWNLMSVNIFSQGPLGDQLLLISVTENAGNFQSLIFFLIQIVVLPVLMLFYFRYLKKKQGGYLILN